MPPLLRLNRTGLSSQQFNVLRASYITWAQRKRLPTSEWVALELFTGGRAPAINADVRDGIPLNMPDQKVFYYSGFGIRRLKEKNGGVLGVYTDHAPPANLVNAFRNAVRNKEDPPYQASGIGIHEDPGIPLMKGPGPAYDDPSSPAEKQPDNHVSPFPSSTQLLFFGSPSHIRHESPDNVQDLNLHAFPPCTQFAVSIPPTHTHPETIYLYERDDDWACECGKTSNKRNTSVER